MPVEVLDKCSKFYVPELDDDTVKMLSANVNRGKVALHGTIEVDGARRKVWEDIHKHGLKNGRAAYVSANRIFHAETAGSYTNALGEPQFTTLSYSSGGGMGVGGWGPGPKTCRVVVSLLTQSSVPSKPVMNARPIKGWLTSTREHTIPLWMIEIDTKDFAELVLKYCKVKELSRWGNRGQLIHRIQELYGVDSIAGCRLV